MIAVSLVSLVVVLLLAACGWDRDNGRRIVQDEIASVGIPAGPLGQHGPPGAGAKKSSGVCVTVEDVTAEGEREDIRVERIAVTRSDGRHVEHLVSRYIGHALGVLLVPRDVGVTSEPVAIASPTDLSETVLILGRIKKRTENAIQETGDVDVHWGSKYLIGTVIGYPGGGSAGGGQPRHR